MYVSSMRKSFKDSLKALEADIQHANTLASEFSREYDGACLQLRMSYSPAAHFFLFLVQWTDCHLAGILGLLRILIYKVYVDGSTTMSTHERKATIREFYAVIYPSLLQLQGGVSDSEERKQKEIVMERYHKKDEEEGKPQTDVDIEREEECGICMEPNSKILLPNCNHALEVTVMPILSGQSKASKLRRPLGFHRKQRHCRYVDDNTGEPQEAFHMVSEVPLSVFTNMLVRGNAAMTFA
ncbi:E3 ubiquitin-protein ligase AIRP2-like protein [Drosera capensis]